MRSTFSASPMVRRIRDRLSDRGGGDQFRGALGDRARYGIAVLKSAVAARNFLRHAVEGRRQAIEFRNSCCTGTGRPVATAPARRDGQQGRERLRNVTADVDQGGEDGKQKHTDNRRGVQPDRSIDLGEDACIVPANEHGDAFRRRDVDRNVSEQAGRAVDPRRLDNSLGRRMEQRGQAVGDMLADAGRIRDNGQSGSRCDRRC